MASPRQQLDTLPELQEKEDAAELQKSPCVAWRHCCCSLSRARAPRANRLLRYSLGSLMHVIPLTPLCSSCLFFASQEWLREAELKHCRVAMLAVVGFVFTDFYTLPGFEYSTVEAHDACVASGAMSQLLLWIGLLEVVSLISIDQMLRGSGREPGDFGFDPIGFSTDPKKKADLQMKELANGRLAMFAFGGVVTQSVLTGNSFPYLFGDATGPGAFSGGDFAWNVVAGF